MAKRESQGLQIALILLVMVTVLLCISTYYFWSQSQKLAKEAESAKQSAQTASNSLRTKADENVQLLQYLGYAGEAPLSEVEEGYKQAMLLYGQSVPEGERNYRALPEHLVKVVQERNSQINQLSDDNLKLKNDHKAAVEELQKQLAETGARWEQAKADAAKWRNEFESTQEDLKQKVATVEKTYASAKQRLSKENVQLKSQLATTTEKEGTLRERVDELDKKLTGLQRKTFESADGKITYVNQRSRFVYINLGRQDSLQRQSTFSVYDVDENNLARSEPKGSIEVTRLLGDHLAEARILQDSVTDPIISGDLIYTPLWQAGRPVRFALAGALDIDQDGIDDRELIKSLISINGGLVDAELDEMGKRTGEMSIETRYLVIGKLKTNNRAGTQAFAAMREEAKTFGATEMSLDRFLADIGYEGVGRTVALGSAAKASDFRTKPEKKGTGRFRPRKPPVRKLDPEVVE